MTTPTPTSTDRRPSLVGGAGWTAVGQFGSQAVNFLANLALVVPLGPAEFGVIGFAWAVLLLLDALADFGTGTALVQRRVLDQKVLDTAFTINLVCAGIAMAGVVALGFLVHPIRAVAGGNAFDGPATAMVLWQLTPACILSTLGSIHRALLHRQLELALVAKVQFVASVARAVVGVGLALLGCGVTSLVVGWYVGGICIVAGFWWRTRQPLRLRFDREEGRDLLRFGVHLVAFNLMNTTLQRVDAFVLSATLGQVNFGIFTLARQLVLQTVEIGGQVSRSVLLPKLARLQDRVARQRLYYLRCDQLLAGFLLPMLVAATVLIDLLADSVLPAKWALVGPTAALLLPAAIATILLQSPGSALMASGQSKAMLHWGLLRGAAMLLACAASVWLPLPGVALVLGALLFAALPGLLAGAARVLQLPRAALFASIWELSGATMAALAVTFGVRALAEWLQWPALVVLAIAGGACLFTFATVAWLVDAPIARLAARLLRSRRRRG